MRVTGVTSGSLRANSSVGRNVSAGVDPPQQPRLQAGPLLAPLNEAEMPLQPRGDCAAGDWSFISSCGKANAGDEGQKQRVPSQAWQQLLHGGGEMQQICGDGSGTADFIIPCGASASALYDDIILC